MPWSFTRWWIVLVTHAPDPRAKAYAKTVLQRYKEYFGKPSKKVRLFSAAVQVMMWKEKIRSKLITTICVNPGLSILLIVFNSLILFPWLFLSVGSIFSSSSIFSPGSFFSVGSIFSSSSIFSPGSILSSLDFLWAFLIHLVNNSSKYLGLPASG